MNEIIEKIGLPACLEQLAEECSELSKAALKLARKQRRENPPPVTSQEALANLKEEIADVKVCVNIVTDYLCLHDIEYIMDEKVKRWLDRLNQ